ncbi:MAG: GDP-mannose mannosyl hydrolase [Halorientalis sp.]
MTGGPLPEDDWETVVRSVPIVSVDLVVETDGGVVLGERTNEPAKGEWFVPGGRVHKGERLADAVQRVARAELGTGVTVRERLGVYEHLYDTAALDGVDGKHYVPVGYHVRPDGTVRAADDQHAALETFETPVTRDLHPYTAAYLRDAGLAE